jgi:hypothetical protein
MPCGAVPADEGCKDPLARRLITPAETMTQAQRTSSARTAKPDTPFADRELIIWRAIERKTGFHFC